MRAHQKSWPVHRVKTDDVLTNKVEAGGPELFPQPTTIGVAQAGDVIGECIDPHIHDVVVMSGYFDAPVETGAADRKIFQPTLDEGDHLVSTACRFEKSGRVEKFDQGFRIFRKTEEPGFFLGPFHRCALGRELFAPLPKRSSGLSRCRAKPSPQVASDRRASQTHEPHSQPRA